MCCHFAAISFQVCTPNRYKLDKLWRQTKEKFESAKSVSPESRSVLAQCKMRLGQLMITMIMLEFNLSYEYIYCFHTFIFAPISPCQRLHQMAQVTQFVNACSCQQVCSTNTQFPRFQLASALTSACIGNFLMSPVDIAFSQISDYLTIHYPLHDMQRPKALIGASST